MLISGCLFEGIWLLCVMAPSSTLIVLFTAANLLCHLWLFCGPRTESGVSHRVSDSVLRTLLWLILVSTLGVVMDSLLFQYGLFQTPDKFSIIPLWLAMLWVNFALALRFAFVFLQKHLLLAALFGLIGGPLSYFIGAEIGGRVTLAEPLWLSLGLLGFLWAVFLVLMAYWARRRFFRI
ncbi:DUF2878 domain-containing protein [Microbulbifer sp. ALW1]|uniref:DUF2878 domain-containing protein n=1 Tax=Microbulbifer sp. (strain ALW1) TaxID=1516059 RepID=UPI0021026877|nr:DUF2878 domain-containing protein [Microbulbifer sp. ALW1]